MELAREPIDKGYLKELIASALALEESMRPQELSSLLAQASQYAAANDAKNALVVSKHGKLLENKYTLAQRIRVLRCKGMEG